MKYLTIILILFALRSSAQIQDTSAYGLQRLKINTLLAERSAKFGQYETSLNTRTGIFGLQTKKDIRNSNEILRQIAINDNNIFRELKVLMDYKDVQTQQIQDDAVNNSSRVQLYRETIKKLQDQNQKLLTENQKLMQLNSIKNYFTTFLLLTLLASGYIYFKKYKNA